MTNTLPIRVILVEPETPGNIGAVARAMQCMGLSHLRLVNPKRFPSRDAYVRAVGATELLDQAEIFSTLSEAISDCGWVVGTSGKIERSELPRWTPRDYSGLVLEQLYTTGPPPALVFGRESSGLTREELNLCQGCIRIPTHPQASSLNLAASVQVICYEVWSAWSHSAQQHDHTAPPLASGAQRDHLVDQLEQLAIEVGALDPAVPRQMMQRIRVLISRSIPRSAELSLLQSIVKRARAKIRNL